MTRRDPDAVLRERFRTLAAEDQRAASAFSVGRTEGASRSAPWLAIAATILVATAGAAGGWLALRPDPLPYPIDLRAVTWSGPTDFLLETPGAALLRELPTIGTGSGAPAPAPGLNDDTLRRNRL